MKPGSAQFRRANRNPSYRCIPRDEYIQRAHEFAPRGERLAKKLDSQKVRAIRENRKGLTDKQQAEIYGVHPNMIYKIRKRLAWACVK